MKVVIVGGVAGGASAAARLRRIDEKADIILLEKGEYISYANCGLPYYIGGIIEEREDILVQTPEGMRDRFNIDVRVRHEALSIDRQKKTVKVRDHAKGSEYSESFDKLVLSPGAEPFRPPVKGIESGRVFTLRTVSDADSIRKYIAEGAPRRVIVTGAGYIGLEMAENLHRCGIFVTIVEMAPQVIPPLDPEIASAVHRHLKAKEVEFYLSEQVVELRDSMDCITAKLKSGKELEADFVVLSVGVKPDSRLAATAGLSIGKTGGITVNEYLQTMDENIYAVGDAIEFPDPGFHELRSIPLAGPANKQGRIAADNIVFGNREKYTGTVGTAIARIFDIAVGLTGYSERALAQKGVGFYSTITHNSSHAGYYPGALPLTIKLNYAKSDGKLLGAQVAGYKGVDKACEVLSLACQHGMTVYDLKDMDQAYAPPFSSAKSTVNMAGLVADNVMKGLAKIVTWRDMQKAGKDVFVLDVRNPEEETVGKIPGAYLIPVNQLRHRLNEVPKDKKIYVYCAVGLRGYVAVRMLTQHGYDAHNLSGGFKTYEMVTEKQSNEDIYGTYCIQKNDDISSAVCGAVPAGQEVVEINACGLQCPGPIMKLNDSMKTMPAGMHVRVFASDPGFLNDVRSWSSVTGNRLIEVKSEADRIVAVIEKGRGEKPLSPSQMAGAGKTIVVFDDDFDRALAAFVITNGALSMGRKVTMFFTFWGLNILKKKSHPAVKKDFISRMFSIMLPKGPGGLALSKLNMFGIGPKLMRSIMKRKNIDSLEDLMKHALDAGVEIIACQMSMDVMGIKREELIDGIRIGGVATYIEATESATTNLFI
jgi:NADPH-dependent 2,4-dienoyl-CoA reductase/sulfur reductase-like enzyme/peroxiredoxin family protein/rhodanese-related sulfurtransferase/TusA-related sulfurtransferase